MPLRRDSGADARSKETMFSGLPKAVRLINMQNQAAPTSGVDTVMSFDKVAYNYGPFVIHPAAAGFYDRVTVQEPGVYDIRGQIGFTPDTQMVIIRLSVNGSFQLPDGSYVASSTGAPLSNGAYIVYYHLQCLIELKAGDLVILYENQTTAGSIPWLTVAGTTTLSIEKRGGQY